MLTAAPASFVRASWRDSITSKKTGEVRRMREQGESYCAAEVSNEPRCVVVGCGERPVCEVHTDDYSAALLEFRGIYRKKLRTRRIGDLPIFACKWHLENDKRMTKFLWQGLLFTGGAK
jgi:hypothetical protein